MPDETKTTAARWHADGDRLIVELPIQRATREQLIEGMCRIIRRMTRVAPRGDLCLADHDERELAIELFSYLEGVRNV